MSKTVDSQPPSFRQDTITWEHYVNSDYPKGAVLAGVDHDGGPIYVGRAHYKGDLLPAKLVYRSAHISYAGHEIRLNDYELLVAEHIAWEQCSGSNIPTQAIEIGYIKDEERLYCGRAMYKGSLQAGKVQPSQGCLFIPYGGKEIKFEDYEILIHV